MESKKFIFIVVLAVLLSVGVSIWWNVATLPTKSKAWGDLFVPIWPSAPTGSDLDTSPVLPGNPNDYSSVTRCECNCANLQTDLNMLCPTYQGSNHTCQYRTYYLFSGSDSNKCQTNNGKHCMGLAESQNSQSGDYLFLEPGKYRDCRIVTTHYYSPASPN